MQESAEVLMALALLHIEPEKVEGGSKARQDWLNLVILTQVYLMENGYNETVFREALNGPTANV